jgi:hypothetical protein
MTKTPSVLLACVLLASSTSIALAAQPAKAPAQKMQAYKAPHTALGQPDLQGTWTNSSLTRLERDPKYGARLAMTADEANVIEHGRAKAVADGNKPTDTTLTTNQVNASCEVAGFSGVGCGYNSGWTDPGDTVMRVAGQPRTSYITSSADGRVPAARAGAVLATSPYARPANMAQNDNPEGRSLGERCIMSFGQSSGPVMQPQLYNSNYTFVQSRDAVAIQVEMVHDVRVVRLGVQHRKDGVRPWMGDSIGHYEGDTLVVETTNFPQAQAMRGAWSDLKVTERFTRVATDRILYRFTVEAPSVWDKPWGGEYEFGQAKGLVYEYACHEGNYALEGILAGARDEEKMAKAAAAAR